MMKGYRVFKKIRDSNYLIYDDDLLKYPTGMKNGKEVGFENDWTFVSASNTIYGIIGNIKWQERYDMIWYVNTYGIFK